MTVAVIVGKTGMSVRQETHTQKKVIGDPAPETHLLTGMQRQVATHTEFDRKTRRKFHLDKLSEFVEVLERSYDLQHIQ